jgi:hypothetical protein
MKIVRLSLSDLDDCLAFIKNNKKDFTENKKSILTLINHAMKSSKPEIKPRLMELQKKCQ